MDNLIFKRIWQDGDLIELDINATSEYVSAHQSCYVSGKVLKEAKGKVLGFIQSPTSNCYIEFGNKEGDYTPAFSMNLLIPEASGKLKIEVDVEIDDNDSRCHRCSYYVNSELGAVERFAKRLDLLIDDIDEISMFE